MGSQGVPVAMFWRCMMLKSSFLYGYTGAIFPVPPLQQFRVMLFVGGIVDGAAKGVEQAAINLRSLQFALPQVQFFRVLVCQFLHRAKAQVPQVHGDAFADTGDGLQFFQNGLLCRVRHLNCLLSLPLAWMVYR